MTTHFQMIDVGAKPITRRLAVACGDIVVGEVAFALIQERKLPKGDVLILAEIAAIQGAKKAHELIPLCHPMGLDMVKVSVELIPSDFVVRVFCTAQVHAKTGIEMEVLASVNAALLTVWDLSKMINANLRIRQVKLLAKTGGKSGCWVNPDGAPDWVVALVKPQAEKVLSNRRVAVMTLSDRASKGIYEDQSGLLLKKRLEAVGAAVCDYRVIPDDPEEIMAAALDIAKKQGPHLLISTGGTGISKRDNTPDVLETLFTKTIPGVGELLRIDGAQYTPLSWSSRAIGGLIDKTLVITLPGSPRAVEEGLAALLPKLIPHLIRIAQGEV